MRRSYVLLLVCLSLPPCVAIAQTGFVGSDGLSRYPGVTILCPNGIRATPCNFGGNGGGNVTINLGGSPVALGNPLPMTDPALDALITGGTLKVGGTVTVTGSELTAPGTAGTQAMTVQGAPGGVAVPVTCSSGCSGTNSSVGTKGAAAPGSATQIAVPNAAGNLTPPVLNADGGLPAHVTNFPTVQAVTGTFWQTTQPTSDTALDALISAGALGVSAAMLPLPTGAAKASYQTNAQAPVAPAMATATVSMLIGCQSNTTLPAFTAGQQGAIPCDTSGRPYVVTVPSSSSVPSILQATGSGGAYTLRAINAAGSAMATVVKASAGMLYGYEACNSGTAPVFVRFFNLGVAPTVGTSTPAISKLVPAGNCQSFSTDLGLTFGTGIALDVTAGSLADNDTVTVSAANQVAVAVYSH